MANVALIIRAKYISSLLPDIMLTMGLNTLQFLKVTGPAALIINLIKMCYLLDIGTDCWACFWFKIFFFFYIFIPPTWSTLDQI